MTVTAVTNEEYFYFVAKRYLILKNWTSVSLPFVVEVKKNFKTIGGYNNLMEWCNLNTNKKWSCDPNAFSFESKTDATLFKLIW